VLKIIKFSTIVRFFTLVCNQNVIKSLHCDIQKNVLERVENVQNII